MLLACHYSNDITNANESAGALTPQEAFDYIIHTHSVEGIEFSNEEKEAILKNLTNGTCGLVAEQTVQQLKEKYCIETELKRRVAELEDGTAILVEHELIEV